MYPVAWTERSTLALSSEPFSLQRAMFSFKFTIGQAKSSPSIAHIPSHRHSHLRQDVWITRKSIRSRHSVCTKPPPAQVAIVCKSLKLPSESLTFTKTFQNQGTSRECMWVLSKVQVSQVTAFSPYKPRDYIFTTRNKNQTVANG